MTLVGGFFTTSRELENAWTSHGNDTADPRAGHCRSARKAGAHTLARPGTRARMGVWHRPRLHAAARRILAHPLRLAGSGGPAQHLPAISDAAVRHRPPFPACAGPRPGTLSAAVAA